MSVNSDEHVLAATGQRGQHAVPFTPRLWPRRTRKCSMRKRSSIPLTTVCLALLLFATTGVNQCSPAPLSGQAVAGNLTVTFTQVASRRDTRTLFEYDFTATATNSGPALTSVNATVMSSNSAT